VFGIVARNHSTQGALLSAAVFAAAWLAVLGAWRERRHRYACLAAGVLVAANIFFVTPGRSGYVVLLVCAAVFVLGWALATGHGVRRGMLAAAVLVPVLLAGLAAVPASRARIAQAVGELVTYKEQKEITSMGIRVVFWRNTLPVIAQRPLFGWGTGGFEPAYAAQVAGQPGILGTVTRDPHNQYLSVTAQHGLVGLAVFLAFLVAAARQRAPLPFRVLGLGVLSAWCVTSLANSHFATFAEGTFLYIWLGVMLGSRPQAG
jgi:O-antigen ligase